MKISYVLTARNPRGEEFHFRLDIKRSAGGRIFALVDFLPLIGKSELCGTLNVSADREEYALLKTARTRVPDQIFRIARWAIFHAAPWWEGFRGRMPQGYSVDLDPVDPELPCPWSTLNPSTSESAT